MAESHNLLQQERLKRLSKYLIYVLTCLGMLVCLGWTLDIEFLKRPIPYLATMNPTTSVLFVLSGFCFLCFSPVAPSKKIKYAGCLLCSVIFIIALLRLVDTYANSNIGIDLFIFSEKLEKELSTGFSNRMASSTAFGFLLISVALPLLHFETSGKVMPAHFISLIIGLIGLLSVLGSIYRVQPFYMTWAYIPMAIHTAIGFLLMSLAILFSDPGKGIMKELTSNFSGSQTARFLIPAAILIPMFLGYLRLLGHWTNFYSTEFGVAVLILSIIIIFVLLIWFISASLNKKDALRIEAETRLNSNVQQLRESEEKFHKAFHASAAGISITRLSDSAYIEVNEAFMQITGYSKEELLNHSSVELGLVTNFERREEVLKQVREEGSAKQFEMTIRHRSGKIIWTLVSVETILLSGEKYAINIIFDITDRKSVETQLQVVNKELEAFSYSISHDLRSPLRAVNGYAKMLDEDYNTLLDATGRGFLEAIQNNANKMGNLIDDLLAFSRLGRKTPHKADLNMNELVAGILYDLNEATKHKAEIKTAALHPAQGDPALIKQVFINLISNAVKYSSKKTNPVIEIRSELMNGEVMYHVKDNGEGFDMAYVGRLFGVFQRLHSDEEFEGTGVGLAIVQRIIDKHGGKVKAEAELGKGATFSFTLPVHAQA